jgi:hypothetical protein
MANTVSSTGSEPVNLSDGITVIHEYTVAIDTINTDLTIRSLTANKRMWVIGLYTEAGNSGNVTLKSSATGTTARSKKIPVSVGTEKIGALFFTNLSQDLIVQADVTISKLIVKVLETTSGSKPDFKFLYGGGSGGGGSSGPTDASGVPYYNPGIISTTPQEAGFTLTASTNQQLFAAGAKRTYLFVQNQGPGDARIATDGNDAALDGTCTLLTAGASREWIGTVPSTRICAISTGTPVIHAEQAF